MELEIVDYKNKRAYTSDRGVTIRTVDFDIISAIQVDNGSFVVEMEHCYQQQFLKTDIKSLEEVKQVIKSLLKEEDNILVDGLTFEKGISFMANAQPTGHDIFGKKGIFLGLETDYKELKLIDPLSLAGIGGAQSTGRNEPLLENMPIFDYIQTLPNYAQRDVELTLEHFKVLTKDK